MPRSERFWVIVVGAGLILWLFFFFFSPTVFQKPLGLAAEIETLRAAGIAREPLREGRKGKDGEEERQKDGRSMKHRLQKKETESYTRVAGWMSQMEGKEEGGKKDCKRKTEHTCMCQCLQSACVCVCLRTHACSSV